MEQTTPTDENKAQATPTDDDATPTSEENTQQEEPKDLKPISEVLLSIPCSSVNCGLQVVLLLKILRKANRSGFTCFSIFRHCMLMVSAVWLS